MMMNLNCTISYQAIKYGHAGTAEHGVGAAGGVLDIGPSLVIHFLNNFKWEKSNDSKITFKN